MLNLNKLLIILLAEIVRITTGKLLTELQIQQVTSHAVGKYFKDLFPEPREEVEAQERIEEARTHITAASRIISTIKSDIDRQSQELDAVAANLQEKVKEAAHYEALVRSDKEQFDAYKKEMEQTVREELEKQANENKRIRQFASFIIWLVTLIAGASLGAYLKDIVTFLENIA